MQTRTHEEELNWLPPHEHATLDPDQHGNWIVAARIVVAFAGLATAGLALTVWAIVS
jgi:hypothetical protein